jgi:hypothetical protein
MNRPDPEFLLDGLIEKGSLAGLYGASGVGKTFVVLDWCFCIAAGLPWLGRAVAAGPTIYVGAEGLGGLPKRLRSLVEHHATGGKPPDDLYVIDQAVNLLDPGSVGEAIAAVKDQGVQAKLVVFDTYARSIVGGDENSAKDAGQAVSAMDRLRYDLDTAVMVIHHTGKKGTDERGSGALRGAADTMLKVSGGPVALKLEVVKQKNYEAGSPLALGLKPVGDSLVPVEAPATPAAREMSASGSDDRSDREGALWAKVLRALTSATENGETPLSQTALAKRVGGNREHTVGVLQEMAADDGCPVIAEAKGNKKLYSIAPTPSSDSIPPTP